VSDLFVVPPPQQYPRIAATFNYYWNIPTEYLPPVEANPHMLGRFRAVVFANPVWLRGNYPTEYLPSAEVNPHMLGRFDTGQYNLLNLYYGGAGGDTPISETSVNFLGRYQATIFANPISLRQNYTTESVPANEANPHFLGRYQATIYSRLGLLLQNTNDAIFVPPAAETQPHFIGRFDAGQYNLLNLYYGGAGADTAITETNPSFLGRFVPTIFVQRFALNASDTAVPQVETNTVNIGRFVPTQFAIGQARGVLYQAGALDRDQFEAPLNFLGRFVATQFAVGPASGLLLQAAAGDVPAPSFETNPSTLGRFVATRLPWPQAVGLYYMAPAGDVPTVVPPSPVLIVHVPSFARPDYNDQRVPQ
jgi:hypothetical protein